MKIKNVSLKKVLSILTALLMLVSAVPCVTAAEIVVRELEVSVLGGTVTVTGTLSNAEKANHVLALVSKKGVDVSGLRTEADYNSSVVAMGYGVTDAKTPTEFKVTVEMADKLASGTYRVSVSNANAIDVAYAEFYYLGYNDRRTLLNAVNKEDITAAELVAVLNKIPVAFDAAGASTDVFKSLGSNAKTMLAEYIIEAREKDYADSEIDIVAFGSIAKEALLVSSVAAADADKGYKAAFNAIKVYSDLAGLDVNNKFYVKLSNEENFVKAVNAQGEIKTVDDIKNAMDNALILARLNETSYLAMPSFVKENNDFFKVDEKELKNITSVKKHNEYFCSALRANTPVYTVEAFEEAWAASIDKAQKDYDKYLKDSDKGSGGGGGSSSSKKDNVLTTATINQGLIRNDPLDKKTILDEYYDDLTGYEWAYGAILDLTQSNIINGTGNKKFEPARTLKREEFMKLLVNVFNLADLKATCSFTDVTDKDAWYYVYIASAEQAGITTGRGDGTFGIGDDVTREEMATLIYRAASKSGISMSRLAQSAVVYSDEAAIAPYALEAVQVLSDNQVISGVDNGVYAPKAGASRAQAASAIYNIKKHIK